MVNNQGEEEKRIAKNWKRERKKNRERREGRKRNERGREKVHFVTKHVFGILILVCAISFYCIVLLSVATKFSL